ncbi:MAG: 3'-5' exonuclease [Bacteroidales bacterium]|nr:3'-5' exonuclease [Bacteroidales bacterium]
MELNLERPLLFFDIESTGLNIASDSIIELSFVKILPGNEQRIKTWKVCPWDYENNCQKHIAEQASDVNGVYDKDVADCPKFHEVIDEVTDWLKGSDLAGFNSAKFDLPLLAEEIERVRRYKHVDVDINLHEMKMVDVQNIYHMLEPRNLKAAYRFYCGGKDFDNAHTAEADTIATYEVLKGQLDMYPEKLKNDVNFLASFSGRAKTVDYAGRLIYNDAKEPVISFGKHKGKTAREVYRTEPSYFAWIEQGEFTLDTKRQFALLKEQFKKEADAAKKAPASEDQLAALKGKFNTKVEKTGSLF